MLELSLRDLGYLQLMDLHKYSFYKWPLCLKTLNITSKSENETFYYMKFTETWAVKQCDLIGHIKLH